MRILYVCQDVGVPVFGRKGASTHIREVIRAWIKMGHQVHLACAVEGPDRDHTMDVSLTVIPPPQAKMLGADLRRVLENRRFARQLPRIASEFRPDLIYERHSLYTRAAPRLARRLGIPHMLEANALLSDEQRDRLHHPGWAARRERLAFECTDCLITVSPGLAAACRNWEIPREKIHTVPMAVDPEHFRPRTRDPERRATWGWSPDHIVVGYLGALTGWHRADLLLQALAPLAEKHPQMRILFVGGAPQHVVSYREMASRLGLDGHAIFTGALPYREVPDVLAEFDIGVVPGAHQWATPTKMFEYGAMGIPLVAPGTENIHAVIDDGHNGALFEPGSEQALGEILDRLLRDEPERRRLSEAGRERVLDRHTWSHHAGQLMRMCQELVDGRRSSG
jgi:glycosyltransferase involved in cell wall biosynthesis